MVFWEAKSINVVWDLCVGRGGQLTMFWIAGKVYIAVLDRVLESRLINVSTTSIS